jgi:uncharacterized membrane-anchored protein
MQTMMPISRSAALEEQEKLRRNVNLSKQLAERIAEMKGALERLYQQLALAQQDTQALKEEINKLAAELYLEQIPSKHRKRDPG